MTTLLLSHHASLDHLTPPGHPERPERMRAVAQALADPRFEALVRRDAPEGSLDHVSLCHDNHYIDELRHVAPQSGLVYIDGDTSLSPGTWEAVMRGVGGAVAATDAVMKGEHTNAFVATRPPGHHAESNKAMGFCFFDQAAVAARYAQRTYGIGRAAVVDFDVHHGNGSEDIVAGDERVLMLSTFQSALYPFCGERPLADNILSVPLLPYSRGDAFRSAVTEHWLPALERFRPQLIMVSAGFDAHRDDELGQLGWTEDDYAWVTRRLVEQAGRHAGGRIVSVLEGGYDLRALMRSVERHVRELMEIGTEEIG